MLLIEVFLIVSLSSSTWLTGLGKHRRSDPLLRSTSARRAWIVTLQKLQRLGAKARSKEVISSWLSLGAAHGFNERDETAWLAKSEQRLNSDSRGPPWSFCAWSGCLCHDQKPLYRLSACRGCGRVYYCGRLCQKRCVEYQTFPRWCVRLRQENRAWKAGHREVCTYGQRV